MWVEVRDHTTMPGYQVSRATQLGSLSTIHWKTQGVCTQRGLFRHGPTSLFSGDPLGIYTVEIEFPNATTLLVTPPIVPLPTIEVAAGGRAGEGRPRPDAPEQTVSSAGVRPFVPGDNLRQIHWRTTARKDDLYVRLVEGTPAGDWWIILDLDRHSQAGEGQNSTEEHGVILAASLADRGIRAGKSVGLVVNGGDFVWLPPREGGGRSHEGQRWSILQSLARAEVGERRLSDLLSRLQPSFGKRASLILITPNAVGEWIQPLLRLLWSGAVPTVLLLDTATFPHPGGEAESAAQPRAAHTAAVLEKLGVRNTVIPRQMLDMPEIVPGRQGQFDWRVSPFGRAVLVGRPKNERWRRLV